MSFYKCFIAHNWVVKQIGNLIFNTNGYPHVLESRTCKRCGRKEKRDFYLSPLYRNVWVPDTTVTIEEKREQTINKILDEY